MFTGIIEEVGTVAELAVSHMEGTGACLPNSSAQPSGPRRWGPEQDLYGKFGGKLRVEASRILPKLSLGSSVSVSGCCLTVTEKTDGSFTCDLSPETLQRSSFRRLRVGAHVNLEAPLTLGTPLGGHIVQGHVDGTGTFLGLTPARIGQAGDENYWLDVEVPAELARYLVEKGSVAVEGISLTVAAIEGTRLRSALIPFTYQNTNLRTLQPGDPVNIECDVLAKYLEKLLQDRPPATLPRSTKLRLTLERLREEGF